jgi:hypothetical protein
MYERGSITAYQVMIDCLHMLDPDNPGLVLTDLPDDILDEMQKYAQRYDPSRPRSASILPPAEDQVRSAEQWILARRIRTSKPSLCNQRRPGGKVRKPECVILIAGRRPRRILPPFGKRWRCKIGVSRGQAPRELGSAAIAPSKPSRTPTSRAR